MPRPIEESKFRRFMMQSIMWVILGATIGLAALVDQTRQRSLKIVLNAPRKLDGFSIRLPKGWEDSDFPTQESDAVAVEEPSVGDVLVVSAPSSLTNLISNLGRRQIAGTSIAEVSIAGQKCSIMYSVASSGDEGASVSRLRVIRPLDSGRILTISLISPIATRRSNLKPLEYEIDVIKQVAASVQLDEPPAAEPQP